MKFSLKIFLAIYFTRSYVELALARAAIWILRSKREFTQLFFRVLLKLISWVPVSKQSKRNVGEFCLDPVPTFPPSWIIFGKTFVFINTVQKKEATGLPLSLLLFPGETDLKGKIRCQMFQMGKWYRWASAQEYLLHTSANCSSTLESCMCTPLNAKL